MDLRVGNGARVVALAIGTYYLSLPLGLVLELDNCYYVPAMSRNIIILRTYTYNRRIFIQDSRSSYKAYSYSKLIIITGLLSFGTPVGVTELNQIQDYP